VIIETLAVGPIQANCFILGCEETREAVVIDPGEEADRILALVAETNLTVKYIINTHGHMDHVSANKKMHEATGAPILIHSLDAPMLDQVADSAAAWGFKAENSPAPERQLQDDDEITFGNITLTVIHTPGHTRGGYPFIRMVRFLSAIPSLRVLSVARIFQEAVSRSSGRVSSRNCFSSATMSESIPVTARQQPSDMKSATILLWGRVRLFSDSPLAHFVGVIG